MATAHYREARRFLEGRVRQWPDDPRIHSALGMVYAALGEKEKALSARETAMTSLETAKGYLKELQSR